MANLIFEIVIMLLTIIAIIYSRLQNKNLLKRYFLVLIGVIIFDFATQIAWLTNNLHPFTFIGPNFNWLISITWTNLIFYIMYIVDKLSHSKEAKRFFIYLSSFAIGGILLEEILIRLSIRSYGPEVIDLLTGVHIPLLISPIEVLYYIPVFMALILGFVRYFEIFQKTELKKGNKK